MKSLKCLTMALTLLMVVIINFGCGTNDSGRDFVYNSNFQATWNIEQGTSRLPAGATLTFTFNKPVAPASANASNIVVTKGPVGANELINCNFILKDGGISLEVIPFIAWPLDSQVTVTFTSNFLSIDGVPLSPPNWPFTTGSTNIYGSVSLPGKPYVISLVPSNYPTIWGDSFYFVVEFSEDMQIPPTASATLMLFNKWNDGMVQLIPWPFFETSRRVYYLFFIDFGCSSNYFFIGRNIVVKLFGGVDSTNDSLDSYQKSFDYIEDYFGSACSGY